MRIVVDTNVLLRITTSDDKDQAQTAAAVLENAELIAITLATLCEFCWTLRRSYRKTPSEVAFAVRQWSSLEGVEIEREAVDAGLNMLDAGGDFADGLIAFEGKRLGGEIFVTFDRDAATLLERSSKKTMLLRSA